MATQPTANPAISLYNFYRRYLWQDTDFTAWQTGMVNYSQAMMDGTFHGAALQGLGLLSSTGLNLTVDAGVAFGPTGNLLVQSVPVTGSFASNTLPTRNLVVIRPNVVQANYITQPTNPTNLVPLNQLQEASVVFLAGTPASAPAYPATGANDVVLFGVRLGSSATGFGNESVDVEIRDIPGRHTNFAQNFAKYDSRLRPYALLPNLVGIQPSQLGPNVNGFMLPLAFSFGSKTNPSIFPKSSAGAYNGAAGDTFLNFKTGAISGADQASNAFTPTIPGAGLFIVATVSISSTDTLNVAYGVAGTKAQCFAAIQNQTTGAAAGSISLPSGNKLVCFAVVGSYDGTNITEVDVYDCRGFSPAGATTGVGAGGQVTLTGNYQMQVSDAGKVFYCNTAVAAIAITFPPVTQGFTVSILDSAGNANVNNISLLQNSGEKIQGLTQTYVAQAAWFESTWTCDGTQWVRMV